MKESKCNWRIFIRVFKTCLFIKFFNILSYKGNSYSTLSTNKNQKTVFVGMPDLIHSIFHLHLFQLHLISSIFPSWVILSEVCLTFYVVLTYASVLQTVDVLKDVDTKLKIVGKEKSKWNGIFRLAWLRRVYRLSVYFF